MEASHADNDHLVPSKDGQEGLLVDDYGTSTTNTDLQQQQQQTRAAVETEEMKERRKVLQRLKLATTLCVVFFVVEIIGGLLSGSLAILSDAAHLFSDFASFAVAIMANYLASLPSTEMHTFGLKRSESLAALFSMVSLAIVCVWLGVEALKRLYCILYKPDEIEPVDGKLMSGIALIGVCVNVALAFVLGEHHVHMVRIKL